MSIENVGLVDVCRIELEEERGYVIALCNGDSDVFSPAKICTTGEVFVCFDENLLYNVVINLPERKARIIEVVMSRMINGDYASFLRSGHELDSQGCFLILRKQDINRMLRNEIIPFKW